MGEVEHQRQVHVNQVTAEKTHFVYLFDETLGIEKVGLILIDVCQLTAAGICEPTYRATAKMISETTNLCIAHQDDHSLVQGMAAKQRGIIEKHHPLAIVKQSIGIIKGKLLHEKIDGYG